MVIRELGGGGGSLGVITDRGDSVHRLIRERRKLHQLPAVRRAFPEARATDPPTNSSTTRGISSQNLPPPLKLPAVATVCYCTENQRTRTRLPPGAAAIPYSSVNGENCLPPELSGDDAGALSDFLYRPHRGARAPSRRADLPARDR